MSHTWTEEQNELLKRIWPTGESLKRYLPQFDNRPYTTITTHAHRELKLGSRPKSARGNPAYAWTMVKAELEKGNGTAPELIRRTSLSAPAVCKYLRNAKPGPDSEIHIAAWERRSNGGPYVAVYAIGPGANAQKPTPYSASEKDRMAKARKRAKKNPFFAAAGLVSAPTGQPGRVYIHLWDDKEAA